MQLSIKRIRRICSVLVASVVFAILPVAANAMRWGNIGSPSLLLQESTFGTPLGKLNVPAGQMANRCTTMVSPSYPPGVAETMASTVVVRAVIWKSGSVSPMEVVFGPPALQTAAMSAVKLWQFVPFARDGKAIDVTTDIRVDFVPGKPGGIVTHPHH